MNKDRLVSFIEDQVEKNMIPALEEYIKIPNQSREYDENWEKNGNLDKAADLLINWANAIEIPKLEITKLKDDGYSPLIYMEVPATNQADKGTILLYGHFDKQPPMESAWSQGKGPYKPVREGNRLYGRGSSDDGYSTFAALLSIKAIQDQQLDHPRIVIIIEGSEESGSVDLVYYLNKIKSKIGTPNMIVCMDSGIGDYERFWLTSSLRGGISLDLKVSCLGYGVHSGKATGIAPDSFMIMRELLKRVEDLETGRIKDLEVDIPEDVVESTKKVAELLGKEIRTKVPKLAEVDLLSDDDVTLILNNTWRPTLTVTGASGLPKMAIAGNVLRPFTTFKLSFRTPPILNASEKKEYLKKVLTENPPYNATVTVEKDMAFEGLKVPALTDELKTSVSNITKLYFGNNEFLEQGEGGSIPFMQILCSMFPSSQFLVTGVVNMDSNIHGPDENLDIDYLKKFICSVSHVLSDYKTYIK